MPLQPPPRNEKGDVIPHDHNEIDGNDVLIRRISEQHIIGGRVSSMAFQCSSDGTGMSVDIAKLITESGQDAKALVTSETYFCSVQFLTGTLRNEGLQVGYFPLPNNPYHGAVWGIVNRSQRNRLRALAEWFVQGNGIALHDAA